MLPNPNLPRQPTASFPCSLLSITSLLKKVKRYKQSLLRHFTRFLLKISRSYRARKYLNFIYKWQLTYRSSRSGNLFCRKVFLEISQNSQENTCAKVSFFKKVAGLTLANLLKKRLWHSYFSANFEKFLITPSFIEHLRWLLLNSEILKMTFFWNWKVFGFCKQSWDNNDIFGS